MTFHLRDLVEADFPAVLAINNAAVPSMNALDEASLRWLVTNAAYARALEARGRVEAFLLGLPPGTGYQSVNYRWFSQRFQDFLYVDRIAVTADARRLGHGSVLYVDIAAFALGKWPRIVAEVNLDPPNPGSVAFHERHGFVGIGELKHAHDGTHAKRVILMERVLTWLT